MGGLERRLRSLETSLEARDLPQASSGARERMREHLHQVARLRRGELDPEEAAEVEATSRVMERRLAEIRRDRGEGSR